jgi:bifunctional DNA-binding transcriptional regulator/antitoxin component of YhaV-PrlF toxin-antitoxin module
MARRKPKYDAGAQRAPRPAAGESSVYERGQTVIPKLIREALRIEYGARLRWEMREGEIRVVPIPKQPARALRGALKGTGLTLEQLLAERRAERSRERELEERDARSWPTSSTPRR